MIYKKNSIKKYYKHLFEDTEKKKNIIFSAGGIDPIQEKNKDEEFQVNDYKKAIQIVLTFDVLNAFLDDASETMIQRAFSGGKVKGLKNANINIGKEIRFDKLLIPTGLNINNPNIYSNNQKEEVNNITHIKKFVEQVKAALKFLGDSEISGMLLEAKSVKINRAKYNIIIKKILSGKQTNILDEKNGKLNLIMLYNLIGKQLDQIIKFIPVEEDKKQKES